MSDSDLAMHLKDLREIQENVDTLALHGFTVPEDLENLQIVVGNMIDEVARQADEPEADAAWLATTWVAHTRAIYTDTGQLIAVTMGPSISEYIIATHHTFRDIPYAGGQLELEHVKTLGKSNTS